MSEPTITYDHSPEAFKLADKLFREVTNGGRAELAICVTCGAWNRWDSDVTKHGHCVEGRAHRVSRVVVQMVERTVESISESSDGR